MMVTINVSATAMGQPMWHDSLTARSSALELWFADEVLVSLQGHPQDVIKALQRCLEEVSTTAEYDLSPDEIRANKKWQEGWDSYAGK